MDLSHIINTEVSKSHANRHKSSYLVILGVRNSQRNAFFSVFMLYNKICLEIFCSYQSSFLMVITGEFSWAKLSDWVCIDIITRNLILMTVGIQRIKISGDPQ